MTDLTRIEEKLDYVIVCLKKIFPQIDQTPKRSRIEIRAEVDAKILRLQDRKKKARK